MTTVVLLVCLLLTAYAVLARRRHLRLKAACEAAFVRCYAATSPRPLFEMSYSYGEPVFLAQFASKGDAADAGAANSAFLQEIGVLCASRGRRRRPFQAERAVFFRFPPDPDAARVVHCCSRMQAQVDLGDGPSALIVTTAMNAYRLRTRERGASAVPIDFCPWCGTGLSTTRQRREAQAA